MTARSVPPLCILGGQIAALALARRVGRLGAGVMIADTDPGAIAFASRFCRHRVALRSAEPETWLEPLLAAGRTWAGAGGPVLLATSDEWLAWMSRWREQLSAVFCLRLPPAELLQVLMDKRRMTALAAAHGVAVPRHVTITGAAELVAAARQMGFPCLLKSAVSHPAGRAAEAGKIRVRDAAELTDAYRRLAALDPRLSVQEYLPGGCERVALYNAYFAPPAGTPLAVFTGRKLQQYPVAYGTACLSECRPMPGLAPPLTAFFQAIGYTGPVDVGSKWDARDGQFKLLDINPRLGQNYAGFVAAEGQDAGDDLGWLAYADAAGLLPQERYGRCVGPGRPGRWVIEDDFLRAWRRRGSLAADGAGRPAALGAGLRARRFAFWSWRDPAPWLHRMARAWRQRRPRGTARVR
ncbi:MAG: hypothetical protein ACRD2E_12830 [Terriglobales bacterium]